MQFTRPCYQDAKANFPSSVRIALPWKDRLKKKANLIFWEHCAECLVAVSATLVGIGMMSAINRNRIHMIRTQKTIFYSGRWGSRNRCLRLCEFSIEMYSTRFSSPGSKILISPSELKVDSASLAAEDCMTRSNWCRILVHNRKSIQAICTPQTLTSLPFSLSQYCRYLHRRFLLSVDARTTVVRTEFMDIRGDPWAVW